MPTLQTEIVQTIDRSIEQVEKELERLKAAKREVTGKQKPGRKPGTRMTDYKPVQQ